MKVTLFHNGVEEYAMANTSLVSKSIQDIATETNTQELFSPCMVGSLESQFLKLQVQVCNAKKVLDIGTFTGMSALAMAEGLPKEGQVITLENDDKAANVAEACFQKSETGYKISLIRGNAIDSMKKLLKSKWLLLLFKKNLFKIFFIKKKLQIKMLLWGKPSKSPLLLLIPSTYMLIVYSF